MTYDWITEMRDFARPRTDGLAGQLAIAVHEDGRVTIATMSDRGTFHTAATISAKDAAHLTRMMAGSHPEEDR